MFLDAPVANAGPIQLVAAVQFSLASALPWLALAALPWLIQRWVRPRRTVLRWAAVDLLELAVRRTARTTARRRRWLLALRSTLVVCAVAGAAQPVYEPQGAVRPAREPRHVLLAVDCSYSMEARYDGFSRLQRAQQLCRDALRDLQPGDSVALVAWEDVPRLATRPIEFAPADVLPQIDALRVVAAPAELASLLAWMPRHFAAVRTQRGDAVALQAVVISDGARRTWDAAGSPPVAQQWERLAADAALHVRVVVDPLRDNTAVVAAECRPPVAVVGRSTVVRAELAAWGPPGAEPRQVEVQLHVQAAAGGAAEPLTQQVLCPIGVHTPVEFRWIPPAPGTYVAEVRIRAAADALPTDDRRWTTVVAADVPTVEIFEGAPGSGRELAAALQPSVGPTAADGPAGAIAAARARTRPIAELAARLPRDADVVALADVPRLTESEAAWLQRFVRAGGAAWRTWGRVAAAALIDGDTLEQDAGAARDPTAAWWPMQPSGAPRAGDWPLGLGAYEHPLLQPFVDRPRAGLRSIRVSRYWPLAWPPESAEGVDVAMTLSDDAPLMTFASYGAGRVATWAFSPELQPAAPGPWSNFAVSPSFVPIVRRTLELLQAPPAAFQGAEVGAWLAVPWPEANAETTKLRWITPSGAERAITLRPSDDAEVGGVATLRIRAEEPGPYRLAGLPADVEPFGGVVAVAWADASEGDLATVEGDAAPRRSSERVSADVVESRSGLPLAPWLLGLAILASLVELLYLQRWGGERG